MLRSRRRRRRRGVIVEAIPGCGRNRQPREIAEAADVDPPGGPRLGSSRIPRHSMPLRQRLSRVRAPLDGGPPDRTRPLVPADVAVVVLNWNKRDVTLACIDSLARADLGGATVWVVDNGAD